MSLHPNSQRLIAHLEALPLLNGRYRKLKFANGRPGGKRGSFSLVFRAEDVTDGKQVAIKFYDLDPQWWLDQYRRRAFVRENEILAELIGVRRCLQLVQSLQTYVFQLPLSGGSTHDVPCEYFVIDWLNGEIDDYFLTAKYDAEEKLRLFNDIVLAVEALHSREICHRDLKADNLRSRLDSLKRQVVAIDLGTAARLDSGCIQSTYGRPAGAIPWAAPEAIAGLAGNRQLATYTDRYALGCLLFELFHHQHFFAVIQRLNPAWMYDLQAMSASLPHGISDEQSLRAWDALLDNFARGVTPVGPSSGWGHVPPGLTPILTDLVHSLTHVDYRKRMPLEHVRGKIWSAIRLINNETERKRRVELARQQRMKRLARLKQLDDRYKNTKPHIRRQP